MGCRHHRSFAFFSTIANRSAASRNFFRRPVLSTLRCYSTKWPSSDESLIKVIQSEILCAESTDGQDEVEEAAPEDFPFKIEDHPEQQTITLTREYQGESIDVEVHMPDLVTGGEDENDGNAEDDRESGNQSQIPLVVRVSKKNGLSLKLVSQLKLMRWQLKVCQSKILKLLRIRLLMKDLISREDLDENLQKAFHKYLEIRGFKPSTTNFLHEYMINKDPRKYVMWLENLKKFIEA
ncbi:hypothetical protein P3L10_023200 [Capsicum annuum]